MTPLTPGARQPAAWKTAPEGAARAGTTIGRPPTQHQIHVAEQLLADACQLAGRMRDDNPVDIHHDLDQKTDRELIALLMATAAMVPDDRTASELLAWTMRRPPARPHRRTPATSKTCPGCAEPVRQAATYCDDGPCRLEARRATWLKSKHRLQGDPQPRRKAG